MGVTFKHFARGLILRPETADPSETDEGILFVNGTTNLLKVYLNGALRTIVTEDQGQAVNNKLLDDSTVFFVDTADNTKRIQFDAGGTASTKTVVTAAQTANRVVTLPDATDTLVGRATTDTLTNKSIDAATNTISNIANANISASAAIAYSKLALTNSIVNADIAAAAAIAYSKLALTNSIVDADINSAAAISYSKLALTNSIVNADIAAAAAIAYSKLALTNSIVNADINAAAAIAYSKLNLSGSIVNADINVAAAIAYSKLNLANSIVNADVASAAAISRSKLASGAADEVVINGPTGVMTSEATLAKVRGGSGQDNTSITFPASGVLTTNAGTQTLTNKTFGDAITGTQIATPSTPGAGLDKLYFKSDDKLYKLDSAGNEVEVGSGSGTGQINYISNGTANNGLTTGWATYKDAAGEVPVDGTGGSPTLNFFAQNTSRLRNSYAFLIDKNASNFQGEGVSYAFTIDEADLMTQLQITFDYDSNANFVTGDNADVRFFIYDVSNSRLIEPTPFKPSAGALKKGHFAGTWQTASNSTSYRLIFHVATTSALAYGFWFDNVRVGPMTQVLANATTDWVSYTLVPTAGTPPTQGTITRNNAFWRRVGDSMEIHYDYAQSAGGTGGAGTYYFPLPAGYVIDSAKCPLLDAANGPTVGVGSVLANSDGNTRTIMAVAARTTSLLLVQREADTAPSLIGSSAYDLGNSTVKYQFNVLVPISGWGTVNAVMSDAAVRTVAARYYRSTTQTISTNTLTTILFNTKDYDTHDAFNPSNGKFTAPVAGKYVLHTYLFYTANATGARDIEILKNGSLFNYLHVSAGNGSFGTGMAGSITADLIAGDTLEVASVQSSGGNLNIDGATTTVFVSIERLPNQETILPNELIAAVGSRTSGSQTSNNAYQDVSFDTSVFDTHGALNIATGIFTAPIAGTYAVDLQVAFNVHSVGVRIVKLQKNNADCGIGFGQDTSATLQGYVTSSGLIQLIAGDTLKMQAFQNSGANLTYYTGGDIDTRLSINLIK